MLTKQEMQQLENFTIPSLINICNTKERHTIQLVKTDLRGHEEPVWVNSENMVVYSVEFIEKWADKFVKICR